MLKTYETKSSFSAIQAMPGDLELVDAPGLPGKKCWKIRMNPASTPIDSNEEERVHCLTNEFIKPGDTISIGAAYFLPTSRPKSSGWDSLFEIHQGWHGSALSYGGSAPGCGYMSADELSIIARGGNVKTQDQGGTNQPWTQSQWGAKGDGHGYIGPFLNGISSQVPKGRWFTAQVTELLAIDVRGWLRAEIDFIEAVKKTNVPTCYPFDMFAIPVNGYRMHGNPEAIHYMWAAIGDEAEVRAYLQAFLNVKDPIPPLPPVDPTVPVETPYSYIQGGATIDTPTPWIVRCTPEITKVVFRFNGGSIIEDTTPEKLDDTHNLFGITIPETMDGPAILEFSAYKGATETYHVGPYPITVQNLGVPVPPVPVVPNPTKAQAAIDKIKPANPNIANAVQETLDYSKSVYAATK